MPGMMMQMQPNMMAPQMMPMMSPGNMMPGMMPQMPHMGIPPQAMMTSGVASSSDEDDQAEPTATAASESAAAKASASAPPPPAGQTAQSHEHQEHAEVVSHMQKFPSEAMKQRISRSCSYVRQLPRWMLQETLEFLNENFDCTLVADLSINGLLALVFMFARIRPNVRVTELRVLAYVQVELTHCALTHLICHYRLDIV